MTKIYVDADADLTVLQPKTIAVIGYGSQGHAHALNLRDSGCHVVVGLPLQSKSRHRAEQDGWQVLLPREAAQQADIIMLLAPDQVQGRLYTQEILPSLQAGNLLLVAHGFSLHYGQIIPPEEVDVAMVAPNGPGAMLRQMYCAGTGIPALWTIYQDASGQTKALTLAYARALGCTRVGVMETTFAEETETDLFAEQVVLCGGLTNLIRMAFETLVEAGYQPEVAYTCCLKEVKLIADLLYTGGIHFMHNSISDTAEFGDYLSGPRIIDAHTREQMRAVLSDIQTGAFAREWILENQAGQPRLQALRRQDRNHFIEQVGRQIGHVSI
ncbi:ketol-acid reductoisomerase [Tengunoibacter tsumagoiensis]|uniref:Ketol-acid reductoisomerase (NADP(+)) n=1 Tax=Tengunoibacter tsumagoiensis TaxID=2014871 RepID=A0A402A2N7_9CHLR|nr:ketol-acid reductoisomerase [Tengunoibacter tsumagoiensis]GCE13400.1 ketol-acid reductoisomerase [Tengunoibacter tsumagoiensis]